MAKPRKRPHIEPLSDKQAQEIVKTAEKAATEFYGQFDELENALGMLLLGRLVGWRLLVLIHNKRTIRKYEQILGINIREAFPEEGPLAYKSVALEAIKKLGNFWKAVSGEVKVEGRRELIT